MRIFFCFFILFILLVLELWSGTVGVYLPLTWMGFFYFFCAGHSKKFLLTIGIAGSLVVDLLLFHRLWLPDIFILGFIIYFAWRYKELWRGSSLRGGIFAFILLPVAYILQFAGFFAVQGFSWHKLSDGAAQMTALAPFGFLILTFLIYILDLLQKKMKIESSFIAEHKETPLALYRRERKRG